MNNTPIPLTTSTFDDFMKVRKSSGIFPDINRDFLKKTAHNFLLHHSKNDLYVLYSRTDLFVIALNERLFTDKHFEVVVTRIGPDNEVLNEIHAQRQEKLQIYYQQVVSFILYACYYVRKCNSLFMFVSSNESYLLQTLNLNHFVQETILNNYFFVEGDYYDAHMMSLSKELFNHQSTGYILFSDRGLVVRATDFAVYEISTFEREKSCHCISDMKSDGKLYYAPSAYTNLIITLKQLEEYLNGKRTQFTINMEYFESTAFQKKVWNQCKQIPYGQTASYEELAILVHSDDHQSNIKGTSFSRAVGLALSKNPLMIMIPCHRIIGKDGKLRGFAGGIDLKDFLLTSELFQFSNERE
jgi:O-6-methylguanine DNA methyltransferase